MYLLDTNAIIDYLDDKLSFEANLLIDDIRIPQISIATRIELSILPNADERQIEIMQEYLSYCKVFELTEEVVLKIIEIRKKYKIRDFDSIIAATALVYKFILITSDKDFSNIKRLKIINPNKL
nr:type II toxin-antitoxin system VapC family toxin [uncultured Flavobacterium sp.]